MILAIFVATNAGDTMQEVLEITALAGMGLEDDRYATQTGSWSKTKPETRDVSLISIEAFARAKGLYGVNILPRESRRNILVSLGIDELNALVGKLFYPGDAVFEGTELCTPCNRPSKLSGKPGFMSAFNGTGGIRARVVTSGIIRIGDLIKIPAPLA